MPKKSKVIKVGEVDGPKRVYGCEELIEEFAPHLRAASIIQGKPYRKKQEIDVVSRPVDDLKTGD